MLKNENNSCYINSLLVALFRNKKIKVPINDFDNSQLNFLGNEIKKCLNRKCKNNLRLLLNNYYNIIKTIKKINIIDINDNWINTPNDVFDFLDFLKIIFNFPNNTKFIENNKINYTDFYIILHYDFCY